MTDFHVCVVLELEGEDLPRERICKSLDKDLEILLGEDQVLRGGKRGTELIEVGVGAPEGLSGGRHASPCWLLISLLTMILVMAWTTTLPSLLTVTCVQDDPLQDSCEVAPELIAVLDRVELATVRGPADLEKGEVGRALTVEIGLIDLETTDENGGCSYHPVVIAIPETVESLPLTGCHSPDDSCRVFSWRLGVHQSRLVC